MSGGQEPARPLRPSPWGPVCAHPGCPLRTGTPWFRTRPRDRLLTRSAAKPPPLRSLGPCPSHGASVRSMDGRLWPPPAAALTPCKKGRARRRTPLQAQRLRRCVHAALKTEETSVWLQLADRVTVSPVGWCRRLGRRAGRHTVSPGNPMPCSGLCTEQETETSEETAARYLARETFSWRV